MSLMTILHKKGDRQDPNNYRSICVGSAIGKLFSDIFLQRLIQFRKSNCPDPPNQLGFCQGAQTSDHILTLNTLIDKYRHFLVSCPVNHDLRSRLPEETLSRLLQGAAGCDIKELFKTVKDSRPLAIYLANASKRRKLAKKEPPSPT